MTRPEKLSRFSVFSGLPGGRIVGAMTMWGLWALVGLHVPASPSTPLVLGLAVVAAALLIVVAAAGLRVLPLPTAFWSRSVGRRVRVSRLPRLLDPNAAGRPRPRAPTPAPAAFGL
jgi:Family of unknown function (DUF6412)